jgi:hypothetical protein
VRVGGGIARGERGRGGHVAQCNSNAGLAAHDIGVRIAGAEASMRPRIGVRSRAP